MKRYRLTYQAAPGWEDTVWERTADELLVPNGTVPLIVWMYQTAAERGLAIKLEEVPEHDVRAINARENGHLDAGDLVQMACSCGYITAPSTGAAALAAAMQHVEDKRHS